MTPANAVALITVTISCATAFLVAYWHRKQLRQIELFRKDPNVGIQPPPSAAVSFLRRHVATILGIFLPLSSVVLLLISSPLTKTVFALITYNVAIMFVNLQLRMEQRLLSLLGKHTELAGKQTELVGRLADALGSIPADIADLRQRVGAIESSGAEASKR